jgi:hypothetical protein
VLDPELDREGVYPPVRVLPSLSRLMKDGIGEGATHADHPALAQQLYASYARAVNVRMLASVVGTDGLPALAAAQEGERREQDPRTAPRIDGRAAAVVGRRREHLDDTPVGAPAGPRVDARLLLPQRFPASTSSVARATATRRSAWSARSSRI